MNNEHLALKHLKDERFLKAAEYSERFEYNYFVMMAADGFSTSMYDHIRTIDREKQDSKIISYSEKIFAILEKSDNKYLCCKVYLGDVVYILPQEEMQIIENYQDFMGVMCAIYQSVYASLILIGGLLSRDHKCAFDFSGIIKDYSQAENKMDFNCHLIEFKITYKEINPKYTNGHADSVACRS